MPQDHPDGTMPAIIVMADIKVPVDMQGQTLTLDINIKAADAKVGITINATDITGNIPIDIKAQTVGDIGIDIKAATAKVGITINAADVTGNIAVDIKAQTIGNINVNLAASTATVTVSVTGTAQIDIEAQSVGVYLQAEWSVLQGDAKSFVPSGAVATGEAKYVEYTVPAGKTLYITLVTFSSRGSLAADRDKPQMVIADIIDDAFTVFYEGSNGGGGLPLTTPLKCDAESDMYFRVTNWSNHDCNIAGIFRGYEI